MNEENLSILSPKGIKIFYRLHLPSVPKAVVIISHGYAEHSGFYLQLMEDLAKEGYAAYALDHRGHGLSQEERGYVERFEDFLEDLDAFVDFVRERHPGLPLFIFGHSMGGLIAFSYGIQYPEKLKGQIFSGPAVGRPVGTGLIPLFLLRIVSILFKRLQVYPLIRDKGTRNPNIRKYSGEDPLVLNGARVKFFYEFVGRGVDFAQKNAPAYKLPCLFLHGTTDKLVSYKVSERILPKISSQDKELKLYEGLYHEVIQEPEREIVLKDILDWLRERL